jgi:hypothetical protein
VPKVPKCPSLFLDRKRGFVVLGAHTPFFFQRSNSEFKRLKQSSIDLTNLWEFLLSVVSFHSLEPVRIAHRRWQIFDLVEDRMRGTFKDLPDFLNVIQTGQLTIDPESR